MDDQQIDERIQRTLEGDETARGQVIEFIYTSIVKMTLRQLGPYCRDPDYRSEVAVRVVSKFLADDCRRLARYMERSERRFRTLLRVVTTRVAIDLAKSMNQNLLTHHGKFRWAIEVEYDDEEHSGDRPMPRPADAHARAGRPRPSTASADLRRQPARRRRRRPSADHTLPERLDGVHQYLRAYADTLDVKLLVAHCYTSESWDRIGHAYDLTPAAARQRVLRLCRRVRAWVATRQPR